MKTQSGHMSIAEVCNQISTSQLTINRVYQRAPGLWPDPAQRYFIDTIINEYPFQPVYVHEYTVPRTLQTKKEIVDGQQRLTTIYRFMNNELSLGRDSGPLSGLRFQDLDDELQQQVASYSVPIITISRSNNNEILEMFRRMNSFMIPLNASEKRHADFHGHFKWFINNLADEFSPMLREYGVLTDKQIVRMADAEFLTDLSDVVSRGIKNRQPSMLTKLYKSNNDTFEAAAEFHQKMYETLDYIRNNFSEISGTFMCKGYAFYSLFAGMLHRRWGILNNNIEHVLPAGGVGSYCNSRERAVAGLLALANAHESNESDGPFATYVAACASSTHRIPQRTDRAVWILRALDGDI